MPPLTIFEDQDFTNQFGEVIENYKEYLYQQEMQLQEIDKAYEDIQVNFITCHTPQAE